MVVCLNRLGAPSCLEVPYSNSLVVACGEKELTIGMKDQTSHPVVVSSLSNMVVNIFQRRSVNERAYQCFQTLP
jgi:hypothetical protein